jgi:hypothetical protein
MKKGLFNKVMREAAKRSDEVVKFFDNIYNEMCFDYRGESFKVYGGGKVYKVTPDLFPFYNYELMGNVLKEG